MAIPHSRLFDAEWYLTQNPDVAAAVQAGLITAHDHFSQFGIDENRSPSPLFDPGFYLTQSPDVAAAVAAGHFSAVQHFLLYGQREARAISPFIDLGKYLNANPDVADAVRQGASALDHLLQYGAAEGRDLGNGVNLGVFTDDPAFQAAVNDNDLQQALLRMQEVAPFLPGFQPPAGWAPTPITPIPLDFTPPAGMTLFVPPSVPVPPGMELPPWFQAEQRPAAPPVAPPVSPPADEGYTPPPATFLVNESGTAGSRTLSFGGSATGDITVMEAGGVLSFTRGGTPATSTIQLSSLKNNGGLPKLSGNDKLMFESGGPFLSAAFAEILPKMAGDASFGVTAESVGLDNLVRMEAATTGLVDATSVKTVIGSVYDAYLMLVTHNGTEGNKISMAPDVEVMSLSDTTAAAAYLKAIEAATTGTVNAIGINTITPSSVADLKAILVTQRLDANAYGDGIKMSEAVAVTFSDVGCVEDTDLILAATKGVVTTGLLLGGTYKHFAVGDRIATGLVFGVNASSDLSDSGALKWNWDGTDHALTVETSADGNTKVEITLTGVADISEAGGVFTIDSLTIDGST